MKVLLINFVMDSRSPVLGWQHSVAARLARRCERLVVLTEQQGSCDLPANVEVHRVPRLMTTPLRILGAKWLMNIAVWRWCYRERFDAAFVHMNAEWTYRLVPCWRRFRLPVLLWYAHGTVTDRLRKAHEHATCVVTSSPEGFRISSPKVRVIGQGIDTDLFQPAAGARNTPTIVAVGRVSRRKSIDVMLEALARLKTTAPSVPFRLRVVGPTLTRDDAAYAEELAAIVRRENLAEWVSFEGPRPMRELPGIYTSAFLHLNLSETGSMDKAILESLACGCQTLTSNESVFALLRDFPHLIVRDRRPDALAEQIYAAYERRQSIEPESLRALVVGRHDLDSYAERISRILGELAAEAA